MTLKVDNKNYRGFIRINNTVVENCTLEGRTAYWGYETAKFVKALPSMHRRATMLCGIIPPRAMTFDRLHVQHLR